MATLGIGGVFFRAADPASLIQWYAEHLEMDITDGVWQQQAGPTVFMPFDAKTDYFPSDRQWMINLRVSDLDELLSRLRSAGIEVLTRADWDSDEIGKFARIHDPEGNPIELWEPSEFAMSQTP